MIQGGSFKIANIQIDPVFVHKFKTYDILSHGDQNLFFFLLTD